MFLKDLLRVWSRNFPLKLFGLAGQDSRKAARLPAWSGSSAPEDWFSKELTVAWPLSSHCLKLVQFVAVPFVGMRISSGLTIREIKKPSFSPTVADSTSRVCSDPEIVIWKKTELSAFEVWSMSVEGKGGGMSHSELQYTPCLFGKTKRIFYTFRNERFQCIYWFYFR